LVINNTVFILFTDWWDWLLL